MSRYTDHVFTHRTHSFSTRIRKSVYHNFTRNGIWTVVSDEEATCESICSLFFIWLRSRRKQHIFFITPNEPVQCPRVSPFVFHLSPSSWPLYYTPPISNRSRGQRKTEAGREQKQKAARRHRGQHLVTYNRIFSSLGYAADTSDRGSRFAHAATRTLRVHTWEKLVR